MYFLNSGRSDYGRSYLVIILFLLIIFIIFILSQNTGLMAFINKLILKVIKNLFFYYSRVEITLIKP